MRKLLCAIAAFVILATPALSKEQPKKTGTQVFIEYKDGTTCKAMLLKGQFAEGPIEIKFYDGSTIQGEYYSDNGMFYINGVFSVVDQSNSAVYSTYYGVFNVFNDDKGFLPKRSKIEWNVDADLQKIEIQSAGTTLTGRKSLDNPAQFDFRATTSEQRVDSLTFSFDGNRAGSYSMIRAESSSGRYKMAHNKSFYTGVINAVISREIPKTVYFSNGDVYEGKLSSCMPVSPESSIGIYRYALGGEIHGIFDNDFVPLHGTVTYGNGEIDEYKAPNKMWPLLSSAQVKNLLYEERASLENVAQANENERLRIEEEKRREELKIAAEKRQQELDTQRAEQAERAKEEAKRGKYVRKYGEKWGNLVYKGELTIGMTKAMCADIVPKELYGISTYWGVEVWTYSQQKALLFAMSSKENADKVLALELMGSLMGGLNKLLPMLTFENGILVGLSQ
jgi:hypothetical protein